MSDTGPGRDLAPNAGSRLGHDTNPDTGRDTDTDIDAGPVAGGDTGGEAHETAAGAADAPDAAGPASADQTVAVDRHFLEALVCPRTRTTLRYDAVRQELVSASANLAYPIRNGIPVMLADEARCLD